MSDIADTQDRISVTEAAERLGVSERTVRRRIKDGEIHAISVDTPQGHIWRIDPASLPTPSDTPPGTPDRPPADATRRDGQPSGSERQPEIVMRRTSDVDRQPSGTPPGEAIGIVKALELLEAERQEVKRLQGEVDQLRDSSSHWQARYVQAQDTIQRLLPAPKEEAPAEVEQPRRSWWQWWK